VYDFVKAFEQRWGLPEWQATASTDVAGVPNVGEAVSELRERTQLPVKDVAAMLGIKRRHVYNLLDGEPASAATIARVHAASRMVQRVGEFVGADPRDVRNALLVPVEGKSLFERLSEGDVVAADQALGRLAKRVEAGMRLPRRVPPSVRGSRTSYDEVKGSSAAEILPGES
jgi:hypothetical protein